MNSTKDAGTDPAQTQPIDDEPLNQLVRFTTKDVAKYLRKTPGAVRNMVHRGDLRPRKFGRRLYFKRREIDQLLESSRRLCR